MLDCQVSRLQVTRAFTGMQCLFWPSGRLAAKAYTGQLTLPVNPLQDRARVVWGVYSSQPLLALNGTYSKSRPDQFVLIGNGAAETELRPLVDMSGEDVEPNSAPRAMELILR